ncbi:MAG TPA: HAMP domain-containing sensor histidine kinase, partial [Daejeonella sp.]|nr:HAMP domain-containing sensor histidine kinase [Daejeonella sp.]
LLFLALLSGVAVLIAVGGLLLLPGKSEGKYVSQPSTSNIETEADQNVIKDLQNEKKYFAGVLSHDLRSPLSSIILITSYLKSKDATSGSNQYLELIEQSARKELEMMSTLLSLMRADLYRPETFEELPLRDLTEEIVKGEETRLTKKNLQIDLAIPTSSTLFADPRLFKVILKNLIVQAICYSDEDKTIEISSEEHRDRMLIELVVVSEKLQKEAGEDLFDSDLLFSKDRKNEFPECIDLYFCRQAIKNYNGTIHVQVENNLSCRLVVSLERLPGKNIV